MPNTHSSRPKRIAAWASLLPLQLFAQVSPMADDAWQLLRQGDVAQAEATFGALIGRSATDPDPWLGRGLSRSRLQQWDLAAQDLEKAIALAQGYVPVPIRSEPSTIPATQGSVPAASLNAALPTVPQRQAEAEAGAAPGYRWALSASAGATRQAVGHAQDHGVTLRHYTLWGSIALEQPRLRRFGELDQAWALDAYPRLWSGAYANLRY